MKRREGYELNIENKKSTVEFRFTSVGTGTKGSIEKIIEFTYLGNNSWNLGFGDIKGDTWEDNVISNNNDFRKVLQTVANAIHLFNEMYPYHKIEIVPLDYQRKLLYNRIFQQKWLEIEPLFVVKGKILLETTYEIEDYNSLTLFDEFVIYQKK
jgi:hypothetical protein